MDQRTIDITALYKYSFAKFKQYASFVIGISVTYYVVAVIPQVYFLLSAPAEPTTESQLTSFILTLVQLYLGVGFIKIMLYLIDDRYVSVADLINNLRIFLSYFVASFLYGIGVFVGLFLLVVPGIWVAIRFQFYPYYIIENGDHSFLALQKSYYDTQNLTLDLLLFGITVVIINFIGLLIFGIGVILTYPLTTMATAVIYKSLIENSRHIPDETYRTE